MEDTRITFETAKLAKEKGFKEKVIYYYHLHDDLKMPILINEVEILLKNYKTPYEVRRDWNTISTEFGYVENFSAPTQSLLAKWLREEHNIHINVFCDYDRKDETYNTYWNCNIILLNWGDDREQYVTSKIRNFNNKFEEAYEIGLQEALKLIDNK